eukprot:TRINITY_DN6612_c0_g1_i1.p2 TRINITY_DN6612_c0_g1~~TRINITY_DN6612_c0_g1_i1.p2  ORF type:complete len:127 (-),score=26.02 TRINITY_DN6612_c0_g1_i1:651-1031(-)
MTQFFDKASCLRIGSLTVGAGVALGAFGAHALKTSIKDPKILGYWETATTYLFIHGLGLLACGLAPPSMNTSISGALFFTGNAMFSGSLYVLVLTGRKWLGAVTPIGGFAYIFGWLAFCLQAWRLK